MREEKHTKQLVPLLLQRRYIYRCRPLTGGHGMWTWHVDTSNDRSSYHTDLSMRRAKARVSTGSTSSSSTSCPCVRDLCVSVCARAWYNRVCALRVHAHTQHTQVDMHTNSFSFSLSLFLSRCHTSPPALAHAPAIESTYPGHKTVDQRVHDVALHMCTCSRIRTDTSYANIPEANARKHTHTHTHHYGDGAREDARGL